MYCHQIIPGTVNAGCYMLSVGHVHDYPFIAYAAGRNVVILDGNLERIQTIPYENTTSISCIACSRESGLIAVAYAHAVVLFSPCRSFIRLRSVTNRKVSYEWDVLVKFELTKDATGLSWSPNGCKAPHCPDNHILLLKNASWFSHVVRVCRSTPKHQATHSRRRPFKYQRGRRGRQNGDVYGRKSEFRVGGHLHVLSLPSTIEFVHYAPNGKYFATSGKNDCIVRIWYSTEFKPDTYRSLFLAHPRPVTSISWRCNSKFLFRSVASNCLMSHCEDGVCRFWHDKTTSTEVYQDPELNTDLMVPKKEKKHKASLSQLFKMRHSRLRNELEQYEQILHSAQTGYHKKKSIFKGGKNMPTSLRRFSNILHLPHSRHGSTTTLPSADESISREIKRPLTREGSRIFIVPGAVSTNNFSSFLGTADDDGDEDFRKPPQFRMVTTIDLGAEFGTDQRCVEFVHWINNKDLYFTLMAESILLDIYKACLKKTAFEKLNSMSGQEMSGFESDAPPGLRHQDSRLTITRHSLSENEIVRDLLSKEGPEQFISDWTAHEDKFDKLIRDLDKYPDLVFSINSKTGKMYVWRINMLDGDSNSGLPSVSLLCRLSDVISTYDARSVGRSVFVFFENDFILNKSNSVRSNEMVPELIIPDGIKMITKHGDEGMLNLWNVQFYDTSQYTSVSSVTHIGRLCGHRFQLTEVRSHPLLPLVLTSSAAATENGLIAWHVQPVSPLSLGSRAGAGSTGTAGGGGIVPLDKIYSDSPNGFSLMAWISQTKPSAGCGVCDDGLFVAFDGHLMNVYFVSCTSQELSVAIDRNCEMAEDEASAVPYDRNGRIYKIGPISDSGKCWTEAKLLFILSEKSIASARSAGEAEFADESWWHYIILAEQVMNSGDESTLFHAWKVDISFCM